MIKLAYGSATVQNVVNFLYTGKISVPERGLLIKVLINMNVVKLIWSLSYKAMPGHNSLNMMFYRCKKIRKGCIYLRNLTQPFCQSQ